MIKINLSLFWLFQFQETQWRHQQTLMFVANILLLCPVIASGVSVSKVDSDKEPR